MVYLWLQYNQRTSAFISLFRLLVLQCEKLKECRQTSELHLSRFVLQRNAGSAFTKEQFTITQNLLKAIFSMLRQAKQKGVFLGRTPFRRRTL